ncbi:tetratricopeptide repeat protein 1-like [Argiope bruennichi]|uniref:Tetratricopeptide repeat protein 1 like protein n=1 Tax=Argiope bruennichi TaxID=94029 RepID=A0A8T0G2K6_ARGBR|nr:tetratricopeptide repeat protein 1-like [Argiope bruennichi]KAF8796079.1 Tetratricopeptide repeat protein 1 like protein [Argiope bruennichi]
MDSCSGGDIDNHDVNKTKSNVDGEFAMEDFKESLLNCEEQINSAGNESDEEYSDAKDVCSDEELDMDEESIADSHKDLSDDQLEKLKDEAVALKNKGNDCFKNADYKEAVNLYTQALNTCPLKYQNDRSILYANRAAARISLDKKEEAVLDCNKAIELNPNYLKALIRRAQLHKKMDNLERALEDYQKIVELDRNNAEARAACATLPAEINEKNEKLKQEMFGKLKELGNICLKPFGLSTENFKVVQDPNSGGYSINFQNNT